MTTPRAVPGAVTATAIVLFVLSGLTVFAAVLFGLGAMLSSAVSELPLVGFYTTKLTLLGVSGAALLVPLALLDIVLGLFLMRGARWARLMTVVIAAVLVLSSLFSATPPVILLFVAVAGVIVGLVTLPSASRAFFRG
ncbi:hypothetical protein [Allokutzneria sp. NRRL B-24872]|uniref:hypothetical protein n=1 Tax=Allokutzneria sp. NRRL B-24872 TaxID=1137961 RepID=UPI001177AAE9|nr:hypothetical protein [Allokutzneria sp. NRRL B-24872]